jgi:vacuolar iron transporter family protein
MKDSIKKGFSYGLTSGVITTLGLMVGLNSSTHSKFVVLGGVLTIAVADALSDALGIHVSVEAENKYSHKEVWEATISTFLTKFIFALTFLVPILLFDLSTAVLVSVGWGVLLLSIFNYNLAKKQKTDPWKIILEHLVLTLVVIIITYYLGSWIGTTFI